MFCPVPAGGPPLKPAQPLCRTALSRAPPSRAVVSAGDEHSPLSALPLCSEGLSRPPLSRFVLSPLAEHSLSPTCAALCRVSFRPICGGFIPLGRALNRCCPPLPPPPSVSPCRAFFSPARAHPLGRHNTPHPLFGRPFCRSTLPCLPRSLFAAQPFVAATGFSRSLLRILSCAVSLP